MMDEKKLKETMRRALEEKDIEAFITLVNEIIEYDKKISKDIKEMIELIKNKRKFDAKEKLGYVS